MKTVVRARGQVTEAELVNELTLYLVDDGDGTICLDIADDLCSQTLFSFKVVDNKLVAKRWGSVGTEGVDTDDRGFIRVSNDMD